MNTEVSVLYFAKSAELTGLKAEDITVPSNISSLQLWQHLETRYPRLSVLRDQVVLAVRQENYQGMAADGGRDLITLTTDKLSADSVSHSVTCPSCGAVSLFIGTTRDNFEGKKVIQLEYEAYSPMAESELRKICSQIRTKWPSVRHINIQHRLGVVPITEASVIIGISSPHRSDSLEAVKYCINTLKATVPIWKKEIYESGEPCWKENKECLWADAGKDPKQS
ncbi:hypothetical protein QQF64_002567 [Cirrhinus molitorella]|uniref:Molybdopterin synthase catalytic subunit n=2 Tax=Cirrhinus molitorella TaxID=172907 RepID=A0AA88P7P8_9TELE|nr:hypothetical protein Q8A67_023923 [Cirrhinus molitorella]